MKLSYGQKLGIVFSLIAVGATSLVSVMFYYNMESVLIRGMGDRLLDVGRTAAYLIDEEDLAAIRQVRDVMQEDLAPTKLILPLLGPGDYKPAISESLQRDIEKRDAFQRLVMLLRRIKAAAPVKPVSELKRIHSVDEVAKDSTIAYATLLVPTPLSTNAEYLQFVADADYDHPDFPNPVGSLYKINSPGITEALSSRVAAADPNFELEEGQYLLTAGIPIFDSNGQFLAVFALDYNAMSEANQINSLFLIIVSIVLGAFILSVIAAVIMARVLNRPISVLRAGAEEVAKRKFDTKIDLNSQDELGLLASSFNMMVEEIGEYAQGLEELNSAYSRFVPKEFLNHLGRDQITDVVLGDQVQRRMTVLFSDIRAFTSISETMSPRDNIDFINDYLQLMSPVIREHDGFIDKYIGDAIMALFPETPDSSVQAAIGMHRKLEAFNEEGRDLGRPKVSIGVGLHLGILMLGTVGEPERMDGTVISDAVNLSSRLEGLTKEYGASIIVTERLVEALSDPSAFELRNLGKVKVKGKSKDVRILEVIDGDTEDQQRKKIVTREHFERGLRSIERSNFERGLRFMKKVLRVNRDDVAAQHFAKICRWQLARAKKVTESSQQEDSRSLLTPYPEELKADRKKG